MTRRLAQCVFPIVVLGVLESAASAEDSAPQAGSQQIEIRCDPGEACVALPRSLKVWPASIIVTGTEPWECTIVSGDRKRACGQAGELSPEWQPFLEFQSTSHPERKVDVMVAVAPPRLDGPLQIAAEVWLLIALLAAATVATLAWISTARARRQSEEVQQSIDGLVSMLREITEKLAAPPEQRESPMQAVHEPAYLGRETEELKWEIGQFVKSAKACAVALGNIPDDAKTRIREMEEVLSNVGAGSDLSALRQWYRKSSRTIAQFALQSTDQFRKDPRQRNEAAEGALRELLRVAGYSLVDPEPLAKYSEDRHMISRREQTDSRERRGFIARVDRRGLLDSDDRVIQKASVVLYD